MSEILACFRDDVRVGFDQDSVNITSPSSTLTVRVPDGAIRASLALLAAGPIAMDKVFAPLAPGERAQLERLLGRVGHLLVRVVVAGGCELVRVEDTARRAPGETVEVESGSLVRLSRFALCRARSGTLVLESPLATVRVLLVHQAARELVGLLATEPTAGELARSVADELPEGETHALLNLLATSGFVEVSAPGQGFDEDPVLRQWDFHDLLFHSRIRSGRFDEPIGGVFPHRGVIPPRPAAKPLPEGPSIQLHRPVLEDIAQRDPTLIAAMECRRSIRSYAEEPLTAVQLGEFLYRVGRTRAHFRPTEDDGPGGEMISRPYPTGGSAFELELYLTVGRCAGIDQGIYYYDPVGHRLILVNDDSRDREAMLEVASLSTSREADPDILITMTSRFQRLSWKYRRIAYATTIRHTGVLYQTMYLVATAMGMAPCGLGIGNADMSARVLGLDYLQESSVGDFILGSRPSGDLGIWDQGQGWQWVNDAEWAAWASSSIRR